MTIINTIDLAGAALDWAVAKAAGWPVAQEGRWLVTNEDVLLEEQDGSPCSPSTDWGTGGPLIKGAGISINSPGARVHRNGGPNAGWGQTTTWTASSRLAGVNGRRSIAWHEDEPLVAAMRCFVMFRLGGQVDVPEGLVW